MLLFYMAHNQLTHFYIESDQNQKKFLETYLKRDE